MGSYEVRDLEGMETEWEEEDCEDHFDLYEEVDSDYEASGLVCMWI